MLIQFLQTCNSLNKHLFEGFDSLIEGVISTEWLADAIIDSVHTLPILFILFVIIQAIEYFCFDNVKSFMRKTEGAGPIIGGLLSIIPQCGFSIIASLLYLRKYLTKGTLIAIYLATSDEAFPILLTKPDKIHYIIPIILIKLGVAIIAGYSIDLFLKNEKYSSKQDANDIKKVEGCCKHSLSKHIEGLLIHPIKHTLNIFSFILIITIFLNFFINVCLQIDIVHNIFKNIKILEPVITAFLGLIPNCAISVSLTMLLMSGSLKFSSVMAGLLSNAGLGILVLLRKNRDFKDTLKIILILLVISILTGYILRIIGL